MNSVYAFAAICIALPVIVIGVLAWFGAFSPRWPKAGGWEHRSSFWKQAKKWRP